MSRPKLIFSVLSCLIFFGLSAKASTKQQTLSFDRINTESGLSSNRINAVVQDFSGFIWIGTDDGLNRFDGFEIKKFVKQINTETALSSNSILALFNDSRDQLWILTTNYLHKYNRETDSFSRYLLSDQKISYRYENKGMITEDIQGNIWIGSPIFGLFMIEKFGNSCRRMLPELNDISCLYPDKSGNLWIGNGKGEVICYQQSLEKITKYQIPQKFRRSVKDDYVWNIERINGTEISLVLTSGFFNLNLKTGQITLNDYINGKIRHNELELRKAVREDDNLWIGTQGQGLYRVNLNNGSTILFQNINNNKNSLSNNSITGIYKDRQGTLWISTKDGLNKLDLRPKLFNHYQHDPNISQSLHYNFISSFCEGPEHKIWIGTFGKGISVFDPTQETFDPLMNEPGNPASLINDAVRALEPDQNGNIWIGTVNGLSCYEHRAKRFKNYDLSKLSGVRFANDILSLLITDDSTLWIGTNGAGILKIQIKNQDIRDVISYNTFNHFLTSGKIRKMIRLRSGAIGLATFGGGVNIIRNGQVTKITPSSVSGSTDSDYINALCEDNEKRLWIGTWDGLFITDSSYTLIDHLGTFNGLPSGEITGILTDLSGDLWVGSMNGLSHLSKKSGSGLSITNYSPHDGLQGYYFTTYSTMRTKGGEMYFGGHNGFNRFSPSQISLNSDVPKVFIVDFQIYNQTAQINDKIKGRILLKQNILDTKSIVLNYRHRVIGFKFAALNTSQVEKVKYAYMLKGFDNEWIYRDYNNRLITYNNLPPGNYELIVKACNSDGIWNDNSTSVKLKILPPFWMTWWAYMIYAGLFAGLLLLVRHISVLQANLKNKALVEHIERQKDAEINNLKIKFFINISHEIRTPLTLIVAPLEKLLRNNKLPDDVRKGLTLVNNNAMRLLNLVNELLEFRKIETGNVHLKVSSCNLIDFIHNIKKNFDNQASHQNITFTVTTNIEKLDLWFDPDSFEKIFFNLLSNAFKFTPRGHAVTIKIQFLKEEQLCEIDITNTGVGITGDKIGKLFDRFYQVDSKNFSNYQMGSGIGLSIVKNLVELHQGQIRVESDGENYTSFKMYFRTGHNHLINKDFITISDYQEKQEYAALHPHVQLSLEETGNTGSENTSENSKTEKTTLLIVEDNPEIRFYLKETLKPLYKVIEANNGRNGMNKAIEFIPDLIITDVMMPEMDGIEMCRRLKNEMLTQHIPIIILTAKSALEDTLEGLDSGADEYVPKPFHEQLLLAKINSLISNRKKIRQKYHQIEKLKDESENTDTVTSNDPFVKRVMDYILENISDAELNNSKIEAYFKTNKMQLYRKLKAVTGWSVNNLIKEIRMQEARRLLKYSEMNVSEIAYKTGFSDPLYFSRFFKKEMGVAPNQFRKKFRDETKNIFENSCKTDDRINNSNQKPQQNYL